MRRRVVITGMGAITPLGHSVAEMFRACCEGYSGVGPIHNFNARRFPTTFAAEVKNFDLARWVKHPERFNDTGVNTRFALAAARQDLGRREPSRGSASRRGSHSLRPAYPERPRLPVAGSGPIPLFAGSMYSEPSTFSYVNDRD